MPHDSGSARALLFVADLTSREEFLAAFGPFASEGSFLLATHRSELPETGDRLVFRLALADGETMLAGEAVVTGNRGSGRRGVVRLEPSRLDAASRACHAELAARPRRDTGRDLLDSAMDRLPLCHVLEEAQATGEITVPELEHEPPAPPAVVLDAALDDDELPLAPPRRRRGAIAVLLVAAAGAVVVLTLLLRGGAPERVSSAASPSDQMTDPGPDPDPVPDPDPGSGPEPVADPVSAHAPAPRRPPPPRAGAPQVTLHLLSSPPGATFRVNGTELGAAPTSIRLPPGSTANIYADFDGLIWQRRVTVGADMSVRAVLGQ